MTINMVVDLRTQDGIRTDVRAGLKALLVQGRQIWEGDPMNPDVNARRHTPAEIVVRLMKSVDDLAGLARDGNGAGPKATPEYRMGLEVAWRNAVKKELGNIVFSTVRFIDDLGFDPLECLELAIDAQEKFARSGRPR